MSINVFNDYYKCNVIDGYLGGDENHDTRNSCHTSDRIRSLTEKYGRDQTSEELSVSFQTSAAGRYRGAITEPVPNYHSTLPERDHHGMNTYEIGESSHWTGPHYSTGYEIGKFCAQGQCQDGRMCWFPHYSAHQSQMGHDTVAMHTSHDFFTNGKENPGSQGIFRGADSINSEQFQNTLATNGKLSRINRLYTAPQNIAQVTESQEKVYQSREAPIVQFTTHLLSPTAAWPLNDQVHRNEFSEHQKTQDEFVGSQPHVKTPVLSLPDQPILLEAHALPDLSAHNGQGFNFDGQIQKNLVAVRQSTISKQVQDTGVHRMQMQSIGSDVQDPHQTLQKLSIVPHKSADMVGAQINHNTNSEDACIDPNLAPYNAKAPLTGNHVRSQSSKRNRDPRLVTSSSAAPPSVPVPPNQQGIMVQPKTSVMSERKVHRFEIAIGSDGKPEILSHEILSQSVASSAANTKVNPSEGNEAESKGTVQAKENGNTVLDAQRIFKNELINFVKEGLKEAWHGGRLTKGLYKIIVRKAVEKIMSSEKNIPNTKQSVGSYLTLHKKKIDRLIQEYLGMYNVKLGC